MMVFFSGFFAASMNADRDTFRMNYRPWTARSWESTECQRSMSGKPLLMRCAGNRAIAEMRRIVMAADHLGSGNPRRDDDAVQSFEDAKELLRAPPPPIMARLGAVAGSDVQGKRRAAFRHPPIALEPT